MDVSSATRTPLAEHVILIEGDFTHVSAVLERMEMVTVRSANASHVLFTLPSGAAAVARPHEQEDLVEVVVKDATGGIATRVLTTQLRTVLDDEVRLLEDPESA